MIVKKSKIGIIGLGSISDMHLKSYQKLEEVEVFAVCDLNQERAEEKAKQYGASHVYTNYKDLLANPEIEAVSICTWNNSHAEISIAALHAGKHVLVEKPLCRTVEEALQIEAAVRETGKTLQVGFVRRYDTNAQLVKRFINNGELGEVYYAKASCIRRLGNPGGWFADKERSGGGPLIDLGVHVIDVCWYLMGRPKPVSVSGNTYKKLGNRAHIRNLSFYQAADYDPSVNGVEDMANALIRFENGASLLVDVSFTLHAKKDEISVKLYGDQGGVELEPELLLVTEKHDTILNITPQTDNKSINIDEAFYNEVSHFVSCCRTGSTPISPVEDGLTMMKILCAIYESAAKGTEIQL
ncbi:Gfo/Idh/MocA family oxidoreductase [Paenibacillus sp. SYP-B3998]|uniref:Gfo/Idh/MocA family oxidoreductase n=1 Tax=Paenibacillus sp. SYP-B3998 TaxID=2678564 RepID=A0A6G3ZZB8_9BACL|nr:Gfo/Idh/MocA family oxidoreductase [Paenibacillus sp. SYP-B3998]NEW07398.1 Gfo/Idh/MocA family oxidoreductase [Paenibacillus sp. SYP-B3998]